MEGGHILGRLLAGLARTLRAPGLGHTHHHHLCPWGAWPKVPSRLLMCLLKEAPSASASCLVSCAGYPSQSTACPAIVKRNLAEGKEV